MKIKVDTASFTKAMKGKERKYIVEVYREIKAEAKSKMSQINVPVVDGVLKRSYTGSGNFATKTITMGSNAKTMEPVVYANWIETGRRVGKGGKLITRRGTKGKWAFRKATKALLDELPKIVKRVNINKL